MPIICFRWGLFYIGLDLCPSLNYYIKGTAKHSKPLWGLSICSYPLRWVVFWGSFRNILTYERFWGVYQLFNVLASHLSTGNTKSSLLMLPRQNKAQQSSISLLCLSAATQPLWATDWESARAFVLQETSLAADKESCLLYSLLQSRHGTYSFRRFLFLHYCFRLVFFSWYLHLQYRQTDLIRLWNGTHQQTPNT